MKKAIVLGGGISGTTIAYLLSEKNWDVTLIEKSDELGGGFRTFFYGGHPYTDGPRPIISRNEEKTGVFKFINDLIPLRKIDHGLLTYVERDGQFYTYPIHEDDIPLMPDSEKINSELEELKHSKRKPNNFEEFWMGRIGKTLYDKFINTYSKKMWQIQSNTELKEFKWSPKGYTLKSGSRLCSSEHIVGYPYAYEGFKQYFENTTQNVNILLNTIPESIDLEEKKVKVKGDWIKADIIVSSISLDELLGFRFGELPYIGRDFYKMVLPIEQIYPEAVQFIYYANEEPFTRVVEYKKLTFYKSPTTLLVMEIPSSNGKLYPMPFPEPKALAKKYLDALPDNVYTIGRLGTYIYNIDMEGIVLQAFDLIKEIEQ